MKKPKFKIKKIEAGKLKKALKRTPLFIAKHVIEFSGALIIIALIIGGSVFYEYGVGAVKDGLKNIDNKCPLNEASYNRVLEVWEKQDSMFEESNSKYYYNIFSNGIID